VVKINFILNPVSETWFRRTREEIFGKKLEELLLKAHEESKEREKFLGAVKKGLNTIARWYPSDSNSVWFGASPTFADFQLGGNFIWIKAAWGEDSDVWKLIMEVNDGRWKRLMDALEQYSCLD
jgi:hypothetical protein